MSKKRNIIIVIILLLVTNIFTFSLTNLMTLRFNDKVVIPKGEYQYLMSVNDEFSKAMSIRDYVNKNYLRDVDNDALSEGIIKGMVQALDDPYSVYMTADEFASFTDQTAGIYGGIGVIVTPGDDNLITVVSPIEDTPGERAGIKTGDKIIKVDGVEFYAENMDQAVKVMKGKPKSTVNITLMRKDKDNNNKTIDLDIVREEIRLVTVKSGIIDNDMGYIKITSFDEITYEDFKKHLTSL